MSGNLEQFLTELSRGLDKTMVSVNKEMTLRTRIQRTWSMRQCARFLNVSVIYLQKFAKQSDDFPEGEYVGRERVFTVSELMHMRALLAANGKRHTITLRGGSLATNCQLFRSQAKKVAQQSPFQLRISLSI